jgi:hypothetical protein
MKIWEPKPSGTLWATPGLLRDCFTFLLMLHIKHYIMVRQCILYLYYYILVDVNPREPLNVLSDFPEDYRGNRNVLKFSKTQMTQKPLDTLQRVAASVKRLCGILHGCHLQLPCTF